MNQKEITITAGLTQAANLITDVKDLSDEVLTRLIPLADILTDWLDLAKKEAIARARDGVCFSTCCPFTYSFPAVGLLRP